MSGAGMSVNSSVSAPKNKENRNLTYHNLLSANKSIAFLK